MARWLSWLERRPVTAEVVGSNPIRVAISIIYNLYRGGRKHIKLAFSTSLFFSWDLSSAGRASALQAEGHRFEPCRSHLTNSFISYADVAQLAEQLICNQQVIGSSPIIGFIQFNIELYYGQIPEWPKGTDCKSAATCFDGSNPSLPITLYRVTKYYRGMEQSGSSPGS